MNKLAGTLLMLLGIATVAAALPPIPTPEISAGDSVTALALLSGAVLVIRGRRRK